MGVGLEQVEIVVGDNVPWCFFVFGILTFSLSSQPDLNSILKGRFLSGSELGGGDVGAFFGILQKILSRVKHRINNARNTPDR